MSTEGVSNNDTSVQSSSSVRTLKEYQNAQKAKSTELDRDSFLKLIAAQLANQDPLEPASNTEFIAQLAQFSQLESMNAMASSMEANSAYNLVGKYVYIDSYDENFNAITVFGRVDGVLKQDGEYKAVVGEYMYKLSEIRSVVQVDDIAGILSQNASLVGKEVSATYIDGQDEDGNDKEVTITGIVEKITVKSGIVYAVIGGEEISVGNITEIRNASTEGSGAGDGSAEGEEP